MHCLHLAALAAMLASPSAQDAHAIENPTFVDPLTGYLVAPNIGVGVTDVGRIHIVPKAGWVSWMVSSARGASWDLHLGEVDCTTPGYTQVTCPGNPMAALNTASDEWSPTLDPSALHVVFQRGLLAPVLLCASRATTAACFGPPVAVNVAAAGPGLLRDPQFGFTAQGLTLFFRRSFGGVDTIEGAPYATGTCTLGAACVIATAAPAREVYAPMPMNDSGGVTRIMVFNERGVGDTPPHNVQMTSGLEGNTPILTVLTSPFNLAFENGDANCGTLTLVQRLVPQNVSRYVYRAGICALSSPTLPSPGTGTMTLFGPERCTGSPFLGVVGFGPLLGASMCPGAPFVGCLGIMPVAMVALPLNTCSSANMPLNLPGGHAAGLLTDMQGLIYDFGTSTGYFSNTAHIWVGTPCF